MDWKEGYLGFLRGASVNRWSTVGVVMVTVITITFLVVQAAMLIGLVSAAYIGLVLYLAFPLFFLTGLALIPFGWWLHARRTGQDLRQMVRNRFRDQDVQARIEGSRLVRTILGLTAVNLVLFGTATSLTLHYMDQPRFCGTACHSVMNPEWTTYQVSPHARVACVECHVGEGIDALIDSKLNGLWQVISATFDLYEQPIPTPVHQLRPARETCEHCHWPDRFHGSRIDAHIRYDPDVSSTPRYNTLLMKIGTGRPGQAAGSHWHVATENEVRYASVGDEREEMIWVEVRREDGGWHRYTDRSLLVAQEDLPGEEAEQIRVMDCVDCHNRATHIYEDPEEAVDERMRMGMIPADLPWIKARAVDALRGTYPDVPSAMAAIDAEIRGWYRRNMPEMLTARNRGIEQAVETVRAIYRRNIHPEMAIRWNSYPSMLGHQQTDGCFRCHTPDLVDGQGRSISQECTLCHSLLAYGSAEPFHYLFAPPADTMGHPERAMHIHLKEEFEEAVRGALPPP